MSDKCIVIRPYCKVEFIDPPDLKQLQTLVGGFIEAIYLSPSEGGVRPAMVINEESALNPSRVRNPTATGLIRACSPDTILGGGAIFGTVVLTGSDEEGNIVGVPDWLEETWKG